MATDDESVIAARPTIEGQVADLRATLALMRQAYGRGALGADLVTDADQLPDDDALPSFSGAAAASLRYERMLKGSAAK